MYPKYFGVPANGQRTHPDELTKVSDDELTKVSDSDQRAQPTPMHLKVWRAQLIFGLII